jgi:Putative Actinobacterial Holin-X, holin superfamily III
LPGKNGKSNGKPDNLATVMTDVSERVTVLVKEELELAKAEVQQKVKSLSKGLIAGAVGAVFALLFIPFALATLAWGLNSAFSSIWLGFLVVTGLLLVLMGGAFLFAWRKLKVGAPMPKSAIEEAKKIRETVSARGNGSGNGAVPAAAVPAPAAIAPAPVAPPAVAVAPAPVAVAPAPVAVAPTPEPVAVAPTPEPAAVPAPALPAPAETPEAPTAVAPVTPATGAAQDAQAQEGQAAETQADTTEVDAVADDGPKAAE